MTGLVFLEKFSRHLLAILKHHRRRVRAKRGGPHMALFFAAMLPNAVVSNGLPTFIAVAADAPASDQLAATELRHYLSQACPSKNFSIGPPLHSAGHEILVGPAAAIAGGVPASTIAALGDNESFYLNFFTPPIAGSIALSGSTGGARGTLYAVYRMLTDVVGFEFLAHDETVAPLFCPDYMPHYEIPKTSPTFEYRDNNQFQPSTQELWRTHVGYNGRPTDAAHGGNVDYASPPGFVHTSYSLLSYPKPATNTPPSDLYAQHPEWFWPRGYTGAFTYGQLCWSNASLVEYVTKQARRVLSDQPHARILSISQNDNFNQCSDSSELALNQQAGSPIGALLTAVNTVAGVLETEFPHVAFDTLAYQWTRKAPSSGLKPRPNVIIRLCSIECDFAHPLTHPNNAPFQKDLVDWAQISNRTYIWNYITNALRQELKPRFYLLLLFSPRLALREVSLKACNRFTVNTVPALRCAIPKLEGARAQHQVLCCARREGHFRGGDIQHGRRRPCGAQGLYLSQGALES